MSNVNNEIRVENNQISQRDIPYSDNQIPGTVQNIENDKRNGSINNEKKELTIKDYLNKEFIICNKPISLKVLLLIGIGIILLIGLVVLIVVLTTKKKDVKKEQELIDYYEAEKLLGLKTTEENHNLLNDSFNNINELTSICNNSDFSQINISIDEIPENLDFLKDTNDSSLIVARDDLDLYISQFGNLSETTNNVTQEMSDLLKKISPSLFEYKNEMDNLTRDFEKNIQNLAIPLISYNSSNLRQLDSEELLEKYKNEAKKLNDLYNDFFKKIKEESDNLGKAIKGIPEKVGILRTKVTDTILQSKEIFVDITKETIHQGLIDLKEKFASYHDDLNTLKNEVHSMGVEISKFSESLGKEESDILKNIKDLASQMGKSTMNLIPVILNFLNIDINNIDMEKGIVTGKVSINKAKIFTTIGIYLLELGINKLGIVNMKVEASTSLDLLFVVDITGSMQDYIDEVKENMIDIINGIIKECPGIDINMGFVGYRDFGESNTDIDFTKDHEYLKDIISNTYASGGGDIDEDVSLAFELALNKNWKSNAKLVVFIADAANHGEKYGGENITYIHPERRELAELVKEMAEKSFSLFCLRITKRTDIMFNVFKDIYNKERQNNTLFQIIDNKSNISFPESIINYAVKIYLEQRQNADEGCLLNKNTAIEVLKTKYGIDTNNPDNNLRFILGKCSPVLLVPGVYATKLKVEFNCKGLATEEKDTTLKNIRLFCGYDVCKDESKTSEEHPLIFSLLEEAFGIEFFNNKKYGTCLGHIMTYFQNENECPKVGSKNTCHYSKYVKVGYYGGTTETLKESRCGIEGITNVVQTGDLLLDSVISSFVAKAADSFYTISKNLIDQKYEEGFSLAAVPNDFRRYLSTNNFATEVFKSQVNRLYANTGKPVVIIAHSYGTLLTLTNLLKNKENDTFLKKIKKFVAMAPPFAGSTKLLDVFLHTTKDFNNDFTNYPTFGQYMIYKSLPTIMELRPLAIASKIFTDSSYEELGNALKERLYCETNYCDYSQLREKSEKFDEIFKGYFPSLLDSECNYEYNIGGNDATYNRKCYTYIYNVGDCPTIIAKSANPNEDDFKKDLYCNKFGEKYFYQGECADPKRNCLDEMYYSDKCPNVYNNSIVMKFLLDRFNKDFSETYGKIDETYFESYDTIKSGVKNSIEYQNKNDLNKDLPFPPVDVDLVYASFYPTMSALILDDNDFTKEEKNFTKGGDETVPTWSSLLTGLKWIYDKKKNNLNQNIKLIEYCSRLAKTGQYQYNPYKEQNFGAISCECLNTDTNVYKKEIKECSHAGMLHDEYLIKYIYSVVNDPKETIVHTDSKIKAAKDYDKYYDYVGKCNEDIYAELESAK